MRTIEYYGCTLMAIADVITLNPTMARTDNIPHDYAARLRALRGRFGLTQGKLAERIGVSYVSVNRWENGQSRPHRIAWERITDLDRAASADGVEGAQPDNPNGTPVDQPPRDGEKAIYLRTTRTSACGDCSSPTC